MNNIIDQADRPAPSKLEFLTPRPETWKNYSSLSLGEEHPANRPRDRRPSVNPRHLQAVGMHLLCPPKDPKTCILDPRSESKPLDTTGSRSETIRITGSRLAQNKP